MNHGLPDAYGVSCRVRTERLSYASARRFRVAARFTPSARADTGSPVSQRHQDGAWSSAETGFRRVSSPANQAAEPFVISGTYYDLDTEVSIRDQNFAEIL